MDFSDSENTDVQTGSVVETAGMTKPLPLAARFAGVFTKPSSTFQNLVEVGPRVSDWLVPMIMYSLILFAGNMLVNSHPAYWGDMRENIWSKFDRTETRIESGDVSKKDGLKQQIGHVESIAHWDRPQKDRRIYRAYNVPIDIISGSMTIFVYALIYFFMVRVVVRGRTTYAFVLSAFGLALYIGIINQLLSVVLIMATGNYAANISPTIFMKTDMFSPEYSLLACLNPLLIWQYYVLGIAFHKIGEVSKARGMIASFTPWVVFSVISALLMLIL
jgi:hypothetical protein